MRRSAVFLLAGCTGGVADPDGQTASYPGPYTEVVAETAAGRIELVRGEGTSVELEFLPSGSDTWTATDEGGILTLVAHCLGDEVAGCAGGLVLTVPVDVAVTASADSGQVAFGEGLAGDLSGQTASGAIDAVGLDAAAFVALTGTGVVTVGFTATPRSVDVDTGSSDAVLTIPAGGYALDLDEGVTVDPQITDAPGGPPISLHTGTGDLSIVAATTAR